MTFIFDIETITHKTKSRVYRVCNKQRHFLYYSVEFMIMDRQGIEIASGEFADFEDGGYLGISQADKDRALTRISRA